MGARDFGLWVSEKAGQWVDPRTGKRGMKPGRLASRVGELSDGRVFDYTGMKLIYSGRRRDYDTELCSAIARALDEDPLVACNIAGVEPPDYDLEEYRRFRKELARSLASARDHAKGPISVMFEAGERRRGPVRRRRRTDRVLPAPRRAGAEAQAA